MHSQSAEMIHSVTQLVIRDSYDSYDDGPGWQLYQNFTVERLLQHGN